MHSLNYVRNLICSILTISIIFPLLAYFYVFSENGLSERTASWAEFATYFSAFLAFGNLLVFAILTYFVHKYNLYRDKESTRVTDLLNRPVLSFRKDALKDHYSVDNIGKGCAVNVVIKGKLQDNKWQEAFIYYGIKNDIVVDLPWSHNCNKLIAIYYDVFGRKFISFMDNDRLRILDCDDSESLKTYQSELDMANLPSVDSKWP